MSLGYLCGKAAPTDCFIPSKHPIRQCTWRSVFLNTLHGNGLDSDDMTYASWLNRVLIPAAQSCALAVINPANQRVSQWDHIVPKGAPELFAVDPAHQAVYADQRPGSTLKISLRSLKVAALCPNTCQRKQGLALAPSKNLLFVGCHVKWSPMLGQPAAILTNIPRIVYM